MSTTPNPAAAQTFMVVATVRDDTNFAEFAALRDDEQKQLELLRSDGRIGAHYVSPARRATFIEVIAADEKQVAETLATLPFGSFFDVDVYPTTPQTQQRPPTERGRETGAALPAAMTSLLDSPAGRPSAAHRRQGARLDRQSRLRSVRDGVSRGCRAAPGAISPARPLRRLGRGGLACTCIPREPGGKCCECGHSVSWCWCST